MVISRFVAIVGKVKVRKTNFMDDHIWRSHMMITYDDHLWCSYMMGSRDRYVDCYGETQKLILEKNALGKWQVQVQVELKNNDSWFQHKRLWFCSDPILKLGRGTPRLHVDAAMWRNHPWSPRQMFGASGEETVNRYALVVGLIGGGQMRFLSSSERLYPKTPWSCGLWIACILRIGAFHNLSDRTCILEVWK